MMTDDVLQIVKSILPTQTFSIGEVVDFQFDITVFEGTLQEVSFSDVLDEGISIDLSTLSVDNSSFAGAPVDIINVSLVGDPRTQDVTLSFQLDNDLGTAGSQVINPGDADDTNNTIRVTFQGTVLNEFINQDGRVASDTVTVTATNSTPDDDTASLTVVEPNILLDKQVVSPTSDVDAGDIIFLLGNAREQRHLDRVRRGVHRRPAGEFKLCLGIGKPQRIREACRSEPS